MSDNHKIDTGYTKIPDKALENIAQIRLSATQSRLLMIIWRYTYGFNRKQHYMSLTFLANATGSDIRNIQRELKKLQERKIINQFIQRQKRYLSFNEKYHEWLDIEGMIDIFGETNVGEFHEDKTDKCLNNQPIYGETTNGEIVNGKIANGETTNGEIDKGKTDKCANNQPVYGETNNGEIANGEITIWRNRRGTYGEIDAGTYGEIDDQDKQKNKSKDIAHFFENVWMHIPNKKGKSRVSNAQKKKLYEHVGEEKLICAIKKYCQEVQGREEKYIMHGSTFLNGSYEDYLPVEAKGPGVKPTGKIVYIDRD